MEFASQTIASAKSYQNFNMSKISRKKNMKKLQTFGDEHAHLTNMAAIYLTQQNIRETHVLASQDQP